MTLLASATVTVPSGKVASDLTNFVVRVNLVDMPESFWDNVDSGGGRIRVTQANGTTVIPFDLVDINTGGKTGRLFFKSNLSTGSDNVFHIIVDDSLSALDPTDTNGRNNCWSGYEAVYVFSSIVDRTGNHGNLSLNGDAAISSGQLVFDGTGDFAVTQVSLFTSWSLAASITPASTAATRVPLCYYREGGTVTSNVAEIRQFQAIQWDFFNSSDGALVFASGVDPATNTRVRLNVDHDGTTARHAFYNGGSKATDTGTATRPGGSGNIDLVLGAERVDGTGAYLGKIDYVYLRNGILSDNWVAAEFVSWETPASFYSVADDEIEVTDLNVTINKLTGYAALKGTKARVGKVTGYAVLSPTPDLNATLGKLTGYAILKGAKARLAKVTGYAVLAPTEGGGGGGEDPETTYKYSRAVVNN